MPPGLNIYLSVATAKIGISISLAPMRIKDFKNGLKDQVSFQYFWLSSLTL